MTGRSWLALLGFIALCFAVAGLGGYWTSLSQPEWYDQLAKPSWTPPSWLFGPIWTALYLAMAVAAWRVCSPSAAPTLSPPGSSFPISSGSPSPPRSTSRYGG